MPNIYNPFQVALEDIFGLVNRTPHLVSTLVATATGNFQISTGPTLFYGIEYSSSAAATGVNVNYVDASATAVYAPITFTFSPDPTPNTITLTTNYKRVYAPPKPILFDKGISIVVTATGGANVQMYSLWAPRKTNG